MKVPPKSNAFATGFRELKLLQFLGQLLQQHFSSRKPVQKHLVLNYITFWWNLQAASESASVVWYK